MANTADIHIGNADKHGKMLVTQGDTAISYPVKDLIEVLGKTDMRDKIVQIPDGTQMTAGDFAVVVEGLLKEKGVHTKFDGSEKVAAHKGGLATPKYVVPKFDKPNEEKLAHRILKALGVTDLADRLDKIDAAREGHPQLKGDALAREVLKAEILKADLKMRPSEIETMIHDAKAEMKAEAQASKPHAPAAPKAKAEYTPVKI